MTYFKVHNFGHFLCQIFWIYWNIICKFNHSNLQHLPANSAQFLLFKMVLYFIFDQWNQKLFDFSLFELLISRTFLRIRFIPSLVWVYSHHHPWKKHKLSFQITDWKMFEMLKYMFPNLSPFFLNQFFIIFKVANLILLEAIGENVLIIKHWPY